MANPAPSDKAAKLKVYADGLKQRLGGNMLSPELRNVLQIDLKKTEAKIAKLVG